MQFTSYDPECLDVVFDDDHAVANAGLVLTGMLARRLGIEETTDEMVDLGGRAGASRPGRKVMTLAHSMLAGGDCIDDVDVLRAGSTGAVLGHRVMAPSTCGTFLRSFTFGHVRQLDRVFATILTRAWTAGAGPDAEAMTIDLDSTITQVYGYEKQAAAYGYTKVLGYHPLLATRADTGEILHVRQRKGSATSVRGATRFVGELIARVRRAGARGALTLRADSGFYAWGLIETLGRLGVSFSITVCNYQAIRQTIATIDEDAWTRIGYTDSGQAYVAEIGYKGYRLIVRRTRLDESQAALFPDWQYHAFITDRKGDPVTLDADHRRHAVVELAIRDWKNGSGANHAPSGIFTANAAWILIAALAHNLLRWVAILGVDTEGPLVTKTVRRHLLTLPGRITRRSRRRILHLPTNWPWAQDFLTATTRLRTLAQLC